MKDNMKIALGSTNRSGFSTMQTRILLSLVIFMAVGIETSIAATDFESGVSLFNKGDYAGAAAFLARAANQTDANNPLAHYYLANAFLNLKRVDEAMNEYVRCLKLDPKGRTAPLCMQALQYYANKKPAPASTTSPASETVSTSKSGSTRSPATTNDPEPEQKLPSLPSIPPAPTETPNLATFTEWSLYDQAIFLPDALARKDRAAEQLQQMEEVMKRVEPLVASCVPNQPSYGETEEHFKKRQEKGRTRLASVSAPYKAELDRRQKALAEADQMIAACGAAKAQLKMK